MWSLICFLVHDFQKLFLSQNCCLNRGPTWPKDSTGLQTILCIKTKHVSDKRKELPIIIFKVKTQLWSLSGQVFILKANLSQRLLRLNVRWSKLKQTLCGMNHANRRHVLWKSLGHQLGEGKTYLPKRYHHHSSLLFRQEWIKLSLKAIIPCEG